MDKITKKILKEMLPAMKDVAPRAVSALAGGKKPALHSDHWTAAVLLERAAYLRKLARQGDGAAGETLKEYPQHCVMLSVRSRDGEAEIHENFADVFYVLEGRATLATGGTVVGARLTKPGETRGTPLEGGARQELRAGDVAHVPAGLPHQMLVAGEQTVTCLVLKVQENA